MKLHRTVVVLLTVALLVAATVAAATKFHGNTDSKIFHKPSCQHYNCKHCTKEFDSREEAIRAGYRPCKVCKP